MIALVDANYRTAIENKLPILFLISNKSSKRGEVGQRNDS